MKIEHLEVGAILDNATLCDVFLCSPQGGMRRSRRTNTLVIVSNHVRSIYQDRWVDNVLHYTGMGTVGNQKIDATQNRTLAESSSNGVGVHLFEIHIDKEYTYVGKVQLSNSPYQETQPDDDGKLRQVWMFPLKLTTGEPRVVPVSLIQRNAERREHQATRLSDAEILKRASCASRKPGTRTSSVKGFERSAWVSEYAKRWAGGICQLCDQKAPFADKSGKPFLESHHIEWLSKGGEDTIQNTVALCPNSHRRVHALDLPSDQKYLRAKVAQQMAKSSQELKSATPFSNA